MKIKSLLLIALCLIGGSFVFAQSKATVKRLGAFTNMRATAEHQYGYSVQLWQEGDRVFGLFQASEGLIGDTPTGLLEDVAFDPRTGSMSFRALLSMGMTVDKNNKEVPSRDRFEFKGVLKNRKLIGNLIQANETNELAIDSKKKITLALSKSETAAMSRAASYDEWKSETDEILAVRNPRP